MTRAFARRILAASVHPAWQLLFYLVPLGFLVTISFWRMENYRLTAACTSDNYRRLLENPIYGRSLLTSLWLALSTSVMATLLAVPAAYAIHASLSSGTRKIVISILFLPLLSNYAMRMFSWQLWLSDDGMIARILQWVRIPAGHLGLLYTGAAVRIGLLSVLIPLVIVVVLVSLRSIDPALPKAAANLGASPLQSFRFVLLPMIRRAVVVGFMACFILSFGDFVAQSILGGNQMTTATSLLIDRVKINDWPSAAALATTMLVIAFLLMAAIYGAIRTEPAGGYTRGRQRR